MTRWVVAALAVTLAGGATTSDDALRASARGAGDAHRRGRHSHADPRTLQEPDGQSAPKGRADRAEASWTTFGVAATSSRGWTRIRCGWHTSGRRRTASRGSRSTSCAVARALSATGGSSCARSRRTSASRWSARARSTSSSTHTITAHAVNSSTSRLRTSTPASVFSCPPRPRGHTACPTCAGDACARPRTRPR